MYQFLCCPRCRSELDFAADPIRCVDRQCLYNEVGFPRAAGQPVLIDFERSIFRRESYRNGNGSVISRDNTGKSIRVKLRRLLTGSNEVAPRIARDMLIRLKHHSHNPRLLIVGGGAIGSGAEPLYGDKSISLVGTDVYASSNTCVVADAHFLPFRDQVFDGAWIQAVLEHVLDPVAVAREVHRALKPGGLVYADTPFMQPVHEQAYDFSRFSLSGHRWIFRSFEELEAGPVGGPWTSLLWSIKYALLGIGLKPHWATLVTYPLFWFRFLDRFARPGPKADAACGVYFFGVRSERELSAQEMPAYYATKQGTIRT